MDASGEKRRVLTSKPKTGDGSPTWAPGGRRLAIVRAFRPKEGEGNNTDLFILNIASKRLRRLTSFPYLEVNPDWSPDGRLIVFGRQQREDTEIAVIRPDGTHYRALTKNKKEDTQPAWSPDGRRIAFLRRVGAGSDNVFLMRRDGTHQVKLTHFKTGVSSPVFSPNGKSIAFIHGGWIYKIRIATGKVTRLTKGWREYTWLDW